jgi:lipid-A-disaccharide synthase-like uncharacterized protein
MVIVLPARSNFGNGALARLQPIVADAIDLLGGLVCALFCIVHHDLGPILKSACGHLSAMRHGSINTIFVILHILAPFISSASFDQIRD